MSYRRCRICGAQLMADEGVRVQLTWPAPLKSGMEVNGRYKHPQPTRRHATLCDECGNEVARDLGMEVDA